MFCRVSHMQVFWQLKRKTINWSSDIKLLKSLRTTTWRLVLFIRRWCCATCVSMKLADFPKENWCARFSEQAATNPSSRQQTLQLSIAASHITHQTKPHPFQSMHAQCHIYYCGTYTRRAQVDSTIIVATHGHIWLFIGANFIFGSH